MNRIVHAIRTQLEQHGRWELSADAVRELLGIDHATFYRRLYEEAMRGNPMIDVSAATARFEQDDVGALVSLLELFEGRRAELELEAAGIFFSHEARFEITSRFLRIAGETARAHGVDRRDFEAMLARRGTYRKARDTYLATHFSIPELIAAAAREYVAARGFPHAGVAEANVRYLLEQYVDRHVLERETVLAAVCVELFAIAVEQGYARSPEEEWAEAERERREQEARDRAGTDGHREAGGRGGAGGRAGRRRAAEPVVWAREVMELDGMRVDRAGLKAQYKRLMKRYHPDVNPGGLRACQRINEAYSLLLASGPDSA
jgi:hypothetical protein